MIGKHQVVDEDCRVATEKAFMFITTTERDCFISSLTHINHSDYEFLERDISLCQTKRSKKGIFG